MSIHTSNKDSNYDITNKRYAGTKKIYKAYFYDGPGIYANINLDPEIVGKLKLTNEDSFDQEIVKTSDGRQGILLTRQRTVNIIAKNTAAGSGYQANPADDSVSFSDSKNHV